MSELWRGAKESLGIGKVDQFKKNVMLFCTYDLNHLIPVHTQ